MTAILTKDLKTNWFDMGGGLFMYFSLCGGYGVYGSWGLTEKISDTNTPKFTAIKNLAAMTVNVVTPTPLPASNNVLTYEGFNYTPGPLDWPTAAPAVGGANGGTNWGSPWEAQNDNLGYVVGNAGSLAYDSMQTEGNYGTGALAYQSIGRTLKIGASAPTIIKPYLNTNYAYGKKGTTLYFSYLMRPEALNANSTYLCLSTSSSGVVAPAETTNSIFIGIFGNASKVGSTYFWTMKIAGQYYLTTIPAVVGQTAAFVTKLAFTPEGGTISLFVNPSLAQEPAVADAQVTVTNGAYSLRSITYYGGPGSASMSAIDEIRLATSYYASLTAPTPTPTPTPSASPTPSVPPVSTPTPTLTATPTATPTAIPTPKAPSINNVTNATKTLTGKSASGGDVIVKVGKTTFTVKTITGTWKVALKRAQPAGTKITVTAKKNGVLSATKVVFVIPATPRVYTLRANATAVKGTATKGSVVTVKIGAKTYTAKASKSTGAYSVKVPKLKKGSNVQVSCTAGGQKSGIRLVKVIGTI